MNFLRKPFYLRLLPGFRVGLVDGLANRFPGILLIRRFARMSAVPGGVNVHARHFYFLAIGHKHFRPHN